MMDNGAIIENDRAACLCDVGQPDYVAATAVAEDGSTHLVLARQDAIGDPEVMYSSTCSDIAHEQLGPLPLDYVRRIAISRRTIRCGRRTKAGTPCRTPVTRPGDACGWHRTQVAS